MRITLIILILAIVTVAPSYILGAKYFDGRVEKDSYEKGLDYDKMQSVIAEKGLDLKVHVAEQDDNGLTLNFDLGGYKPQEMKTEVEQLVGSNIIELNPSETDNGYSAKVNVPLKGYHILKVSFDADGTEVRLKKNFYAN